MAMSRDQLVSRFPILYHMAHAASWPSIREMGLLSTSALLDSFAIRGEQRSLIEDTRRPDWIRIKDDTNRTAMIRDQKPLSDSALRKCLGHGMTPTEWYRLLNRHVFFWLTRERVESLLAARAYSGGSHLLIQIDTEQLLRRDWPRIRLSPINSGSTIYKPQPRGVDTFLHPDDYPLARWDAKRSKRKSVAELAVEYSVPAIEEVAFSTTIVTTNGTTATVWSR